MCVCEQENVWSAMQKCVLGKVNNSRWLVYNNKETYEKKAWVILLLRWQRIKCDKNAKITKPVLFQILLIRVSVNAVKFIWSDISCR